MSADINKESSIDLDMICHVCPCGSKLWMTWVSFDDYEIAAYGLNMTCCLCGNSATAPTEIDRPGYESLTEG